MERSQRVYGKEKEHFSENISCRYPHNALSSNRRFDNFFINASEKNKAVWGGFSLAAYKKLFHDGTIMNALYTTVILAAAAGFIATILGTLVCIGMIGMSKKVRSAIMGVTNIPMLNADVVTGIALMLLFTRFTELSFSTMMVAHITLIIPYVVLSVWPKVLQLNKIGRASCRERVLLAV